MLKPPPDRLKAAIDEDEVIKRLRGRVDAYNEKERKRIEELKAKISALWKEIAEVKAQRKALIQNINGKLAQVRYAQKHTRIRKRHLQTLETRIRHRERIIGRHVEEDYLEEQRKAFRKEMELASSSQSVTLP